MNLSFYTSVLGAGGQQDKINVIGNNIANSNTVGFKSENPVFSDLLYQNLNAEANQPTNAELRTGSGARLDKTDTLFDQGALTQTDNPLDYAIAGDGFFAVQSPQTGEIQYTRDGSFIQSRRGDEFYLAASDGWLVLDPNMQPIVVQDRQDRQNLGVFSFPIKNGLVHAGNNRFIAQEKNGQPEAVFTNYDNLKQKSLERSSARLEREMPELVEAQRAYQYSLRMLRTSDEIEQTLNSLRG